MKRGLAAWRRGSSYGSEPNSTEVSVSSQPEAGAGGPLPDPASGRAFLRSLSPGPAQLPGHWGE